MKAAASGEEEARYEALKRIQGDADEASDVVRLSALGDESFRVRAEAVVQLSSRPVTARIEDALVAGLGEADNAGLRNAACDLMIRYGGRIERAVERAMLVGDADVRKLAIDVAGEIANGSLAPALLKALNDTNVNVRIAAAEALGKTESADAAAALNAGLDDGELVFELACLEALARRKCAVPAARLTRHLSDPYKRRAALSVLGYAPGIESLRVLLEALGDERASTLRAAVMALAEWIAAFENAPTPTRDEVTRAMRSAVPLDSENAFVSRIENLLEDDTAAGVAIVVLGRLGFARSAVALALVVKRRRDLETLVDAALRSLDQHAADHLAQTLQRAAAEDWVWLVRALDTLADTRGASALIARCEQGDLPDRSLIGALGHVDDRRAIPILFRSAKSVDAELSDLAVRSLRIAAERQPLTLAADLSALSADEYRAVRGDEVEGALGAHANEARLLRILDDDGMGDKSGAVRSLAETGSLAAFSRLPKIALAAPLRARIAAIGALGSYSRTAIGAGGCEQRRQVLLTLLGDSESQIREAAAFALSGDDDARSIRALAQTVRGVDFSAAIAAMRTLGTMAGRDLESAWREILAFAVDDARRGPTRFANPLAVELWKETLAALVVAPVPSAFEIIVDGLGSERWDVRAASARALGLRRDRNAFAPLRTALRRESDLLVRRALEDALVALARDTRGT